MKHIAFRILALTLALCALTLSFVACSSESAEEGFTFKNSAGVEISIGDSDKVIPQLGEPLSKNESASCGGIPGNDCVYTYAGFRVKTTPKKNGDAICQIELTDDSLKTPEGLYIGMSAEAAKSAMSGKGTYTAVGDGFSCTKGNTKLQVAVRNGAVSAISYLEV